MKIINLPEIFIGSGTINEIKKIAAALNCQNALIVTDKGIIKANIYARIQKMLETCGINCILFDEVEPDPSIDLIERALSFAREQKPEMIIGLGGGSSIDTAKVLAVLATSEKSLHYIIGTDLIENTPLPLIAIPTTAGTGSEVTPIAILSDEKEQLKKGIVSGKLIPKYAILDPDLTLGMPPHITAATGMDALTHAIEAYISINANNYSDSLALEAVKLITTNIKKAFDDGKNTQARENMLWGSLLAGIAFANAGVAAVHAFAYPLGGMFHIPHGLANSVMLPTIMEYNISACEKKALELAKAFYSKGVAINSSKLIDDIKELCAYLKIPKNLRELNIPENSIQEMAEGAMKVTRLLNNNPKKIELADAVDIYTKAFG